VTLDQNLTCPSCRRKHHIECTRTSPAECSRCGCELEILVTIRIAAAGHLRKAWLALRRTAYDQASEQVDLAWCLIADPEIADCGLIVALLSKDPVALRKWRGASPA